VRLSMSSIYVSGGFVTYREDRLDYNVYQALDGVDTRSFLTQSYIGKYITKH
jgi:hypothetical protein